MTVSKYLEICTAICDEFDPQGCKGCPLSGNMSCGVPTSQKLQKEVIKIVKEYRPPPQPYKCPKCDTTGHKEEAEYCHKCGLPIFEIEKAAQAQEEAT